MRKRCGEEAHHSVDSHHQKVCTKGPEAVINKCIAMTARGSGACFHSFMATGKVRLLYSLSSKWK